MSKKRKQLLASLADIKAKEILIKENNETIQKISAQIRDIELENDVLSSSIEEELVKSEKLIDTVIKKVTDELSYDSDKLLAKAKKNIKQKLKG